MSAIHRDHRRDLTREQFLEACEVYDLRPAWRDARGGRIFMVFNPSRTNPRDMNRAGTVHVEPSYWWQELRAVPTSEGRPALRVVQDKGDPSHLGVAFTPEGKADWALARAFGGRDAREVAGRARAIRTGKRSRRSAIPA